MEQFDVHGGLGFGEWDNTPNGGLYFRIVTVVSPPGDVRDHDNTVKLAFKVADDMALKPECKGLDRKTLALAFLTYRFSEMMHSKEYGSDAMMFIAYAILKINPHQHQMVFYNKETCACRFETISGTHEKAMEKLRHRARAMTYQDFAGLS